MNAIKSSGARHEGGRIALLDGWRGLAILSVLFGHFVTRKVINLGPFGVELFFVLSGRLMAEILFKRHTSLGHFYFRRFSRIYPTLLFTVSAIALLGYFVPKFSVSPAQWLASATLTSNYTLYFFPTEPPLAHIWSLCVEEHMYLLLGGIAFLWRRQPRLPAATVCAVLAILAMANGAIQTSLGLSYYDVYWRSDVRGASILAGATTYLLLQKGVPRLLDHPLAGVLMGIAALLLNLNIIPDPIKYSAGTVCLATCLLLIPRGPKFALIALESRPLLMFGTLSYSIYLWQQPFYILNAPGAGPLPHLANMSCAIIAGVICTYAVERPARGVINRIANTRRSRIAGTPLVDHPV